MKKSDQSVNVFILALISLGITFTVAFLEFIIYQNQLPSIFDIWNRWDTNWYLRIAEYGYQNSPDGRLSITFLPLFPWLIRLSAIMLKSYLTSGLMISNICYILLLLIFYKLVKKDFPEKVAWKTVVYFSIYPTAYFLHAAYTESLFLMLVFLCILLARNERWFLASFAGMLAVLTRFNGILLLPLLFSEYLTIKKFNFRNIRLDILWIILVFLGFAFYLFLNYQYFGNPFAFKAIFAEITWDRPALPWAGLIDALTRFYRYKIGDWIIEGFMVILFWIIDIIILLISLN